MFTILKQQKRPVRAGQLDLPINNSVELDSCQVESQAIVDFSLITPDENGKVNAKNLYQFLELSEKEWSRWSATNIVENQFAIQGEDWFSGLTTNTPKSGRPSVNFDLTINFAKKLCMMSKSKNGESVRDYFLAIEKKGLNIAPAPTYRDPKAMSTLDWIKMAGEIEERRIATQQELEQQKLLVTSRESTIDKLNDRNIETFNMKASESRTGLKSIKNDIGYEINFLVNRIFADITSYPVRHTYARNRYNSTNPKVPYLGAKYASLDSKIEYKNWLLSLQQYNQEISGYIEQSDFEELLLN